MYDQAVSKFVTAVVREDPDGAAAWAKTIKDEATKKSSQELLDAIIQSNR
jgi:hypothetical protein